MVIGDSDTGMQNRETIGQSDVLITKRTHKSFCETVCGLFSD